MPHAIHLRLILARHMRHVICLTSYGSCDMPNVKCLMSSDSHHLAHVICLTPYASYDIPHLIWLVYAKRHVIYVIALT